MPAYMIALNTAVHDRQKLEEYWKASPATFKGFGSKALAVYTPLTRLEGTWPLEGVVVIEFPDVATAKRWYESPAYQELSRLRLSAADGEFFIVDGGVVPAKDRLPHIK